MKSTTILSLLLALTLSLHAQVKKIYLANDDHTDYMWTGDEETYKKAFSEMLDYYIQLNDSTAHLPYNQQSKWNCDGSYWVYNYKQTRSAAQFAKLIQQIKDGKITVPLNSMIVLLGAAPAEATLRDMYYAGSLQRKYGLDLSLVLNMEDQVLPLGLSSLWAGSGAKYSWKGVCACATKVTALERKRNQMFWYKGLDDQRVLMKWYAVNPDYTNMAKRKEYRYFFGTYLEANHQANAVLDCKALLDDPIYPYHIAGAFGKGGDDLKTITNNFPKIAKEQTDSNYQVIVSNEIDFFKDFEQHYGADLPSETISYGSTEWGNSFASLAEVSASVKRSIEKLRTAEALYTLVALKDKTFAADLAEQKEKAWLACGMYFEHDWTADGPHITRKQRADWQKKTAAVFNTYVDTLYNRSAKRLGQLIAKAPGSESFYVFNPLNWARTDYSDYLYSGSNAISVVDKTTQLEVPFQRITKNGKSYLRILASEVPSLGYKVFEIRKKSSPTNFPSSLVVSDSTIENQFYSIKFTRQGVITSLYDKINRRECVKPLDKLYVNDLGSGLGNQGEPIQIENKGAVSVSLLATSYKPIKHQSRLTLFANSDRIEIENYILQNLDAKPVTYSFSLNLTKPEVWHEEAGAILRAKTLAKGGHYADVANRVDWLAMNHFADMSDASHGMIISNRDAYFMKTGSSTNTRLDDSTAQLKVLAAAQVDNALGIINQDGDSYFEHFLALKPHLEGFKPADAMRFALQHQNPMVAQKIQGGPSYDGKQFSLFSFSDPNAVIWALKPAEEGIDQGIIMRVWNVSGENKTVTIGANTPILKGFSTTHIETNDQAIPLEKGKLNADLGHHRLHTFRLFLAKTSKE